MTRQFSVAFDYRSPFAFVLTDAVFKALAADADWDVSFHAFALTQVHIEKGYPPVWARKEPHDSPGIRALQVGLAVRDEHPERFEDVCRGFFRARFNDGRDISAADVIRDVIAASGLDPAKLLDEPVMERALGTLRREHEENERRGVFGVPCLVVGERVALVRLLEHAPDADAARAEIERLLDLLDWDNLDEFKRPATQRPRYRGGPR